MSLTLSVLWCGSCLSEVEKVTEGVMGWFCCLFNKTITVCNCFDSECTLDNQVQVRPRWVRPLL